MTDSWPVTEFPIVAFGRIADIRLGKMLQTSPLDDCDVETAYVRAGHVGGFDDLAELPVMYASQRDRTLYAVRQGDLVVSEGGDVGRAEFLPEIPDGTIIQNSLHRVRAAGGDIRYLRYCLQAAAGAGWLDVICNRSTFGHLTREKLGALGIPCPPKERQVQIADDLDSRTARIANLVQEKRRLIALLRERGTLLFSDCLARRGLKWGQSLDRPAESLPEGWRVARLSVVLEQLTNGYVGPTRDLLVDDGVRYIQSLHIKEGRIDFSRRPFFVPQEWHDERERIHLREGDVLLVQTGDIGQVAVVPPHFGPASCHALQILRVRADLVLSEYLGAYLRSPFGRQSLLSRATGALHPHLEGGIRDIPVVLPPLSAQTDIVREVKKGLDQIDAITDALEHHIELLHEHSRALIAAAVTGQLDTVKTAA